jgi:hypothetical protein
VKEAYQLWTKLLSSVVNAQIPPCRQVALGYITLAAFSCRCMGIGPLVTSSAASTIDLGNFINVKIMRPAIMSWLQLNRLYNMTIEVVLSWCSQLQDLFT